MSSKVADFLIKQVSSVYGGRYYSYADQFLKDLPICEPLLKKGSMDAKRTGALADEISSMSAERLNLARKIAAFPESFVTSVSDYELDTIKRLCQKQPPSESLKVDRGEIRVEKALYGFETHFGSQAPFEFENREHAECLAEALRNHRRQTLSRKAVLAWRLPVARVGCNKILELLGNAQSELARIQGKIASKETSLNDLVFGLYGLSDEDEKIIEDFLDRYSSGASINEVEEADDNAETA